MRSTAGRSSPVDAARVGRDEERALFERYGATGDRAIRNQIVVRYRYLADYAAQRYQRRDAAEDVSQIAFVGLIRAVERFDPSLGVRFSTFAERSINGWVKRYFRDHGWDIRPPRRIQEAYLEVTAARERLAQTLRHAPTAEELARDLGRSVDEVLEALDADAVRRPASIEAREAAGGASPSQSDDGFERTEARLCVEELFARLSPRDREIVIRRFYDGETEAALATRFGVSQSYMSRILKRTLREMQREAERRGRLTDRRRIVG